jgi:acetyltransferase-like isoleucine patch superfamily enzyme
MSLRARVADTPWKAVNELRRLAWAPAIRAYFALHGVAWGRGWRIYGRPLIQRHRGSRITIGDGLEMRCWFGTNPLAVVRKCVLATWAPDARIELGSDVGLTGTVICARTHIRIGRAVTIGANATITDTDFHPLEASARRRDFQAGASTPVVLEDECFIGMHALILKGSVIGRGAVVGAGSVVAGEVPPGAIVSGNPARVVRMIDDG